MWARAFRAEEGSVCRAQRLERPWCVRELKDAVSRSRETEREIMPATGSGPSHELPPPSSQNPRDSEIPHCVFCRFIRNRSGFIRTLQSDAYSLSLAPGARRRERVPTSSTSLKLGTFELLFSLHEIVFIHVWTQRAGCGK